MVWALTCFQDIWALPVYWGSGLSPRPMIYIPSDALGHKDQKYICFKGRMSTDLEILSTFPNLGVDISNIP